jgi:hypothetical protein
VEIAQRIVPADVRYRCFVVENEIIMLDSIRCKLLWLASLLAVIALAGGPVRAAEPGTATIRITTPMPPPDWALLERELLRAQERACAEFFDRYFDDRGYLECVERWGGDDGPDDAIENVNDWPSCTHSAAPIRS